MYSLPQEIEVWYIIPAIRREFSRLFVRKHHLTMEKAGNILGVSKAAVSQYLGNKRADKAKLPGEIKKEMEKSAKMIIKDNNLAVSEIERILGLMKSSKCSCGICKKYNKGILKQCGLKPTY